MGGRDRAVNGVIVRRGNLPLAQQLGLEPAVAQDLGLDDVEKHARLGLAGHADGGIEGAPQAAVGKGGAQNPAVAAMQWALDFVVLRLGDEDELPTAWTERRRRARVVDALPQRE